MSAKLMCVSLSAFLAGAFSMFAATVPAADIKVMSDSLLAPALTKVVDAYHEGS